MGHLRRQRHRRVPARCADGARAGRWPPHRYVRPFLGVGVLGGYTTFSTYMLDTRPCWRRGSRRPRSPTSSGPCLPGWPPCGPGSCWPAAGGRRRTAPAGTSGTSQATGPTRRAPVEPSTPDPDQPAEELTMTLRGPATRLTVLVKEDDQWHHRPLYTEIVHRAHQAASPAPACSAGSRAREVQPHPHHPHPVAGGGPALLGRHRRHRGEDPGLPAELDELVTEGLVMVDPVEVVRYVGEDVDGAEGASS